LASEFWRHIFEFGLHLTFAVSMHALLEIVVETMTSAPYNTDSAYVTHAERFGRADRIGQMKVSIQGWV